MTRPSYQTVITSQVSREEHGRLEAWAKRHKMTKGVLGVNGARFILSFTAEPLAAIIGAGDTESDYYRAVVGMVSAAYDNLIKRGPDEVRRIAEAFPPLPKVPTAEAARQDESQAAAQARQSGRSRKKRQSGS